MKRIVTAALLWTLGVMVPAATAATAAPAAAAAEAPAAAPRKLDVNRATAAELVSIPGIGERLAQAIIDLRERKGSLTKLEDLLEVRGIGEKSLALLGEHLAVVPAPAQASAGKVSAVK